MSLKKHLLLLILFSSINLFSQQDYIFGEITQEEREMTVYEKDSTANAVVIYEESSTLFIKGKNTVYIETTIYKKIKLFNKNSFKNADVVVNLYNNKSFKETINAINAVTHNNDETITLKRNAIFKKKYSKNFTEITFTLPNLSEGSIIEYTYKIKSPFIDDFFDWTFQSSIPKIKSVYKAKIPLNYHYERKLTGLLKLSTNDSYIEKDCSNISAKASLDDCEIIKYVMKDVPVFIKEDFMTSENNFISKITFDMSNVKYLNGKYTNRPLTWGDIDKNFKSNSRLHKYFNKKSFFLKKLPKQIVDETNHLTKAEKIFYFIQEHYTKDPKSKWLKNANIKSAYNKGIGDLNEINLSLMNALNACDIPAQFIWLSTRGHGLIPKHSPELSSFNHFLVKIVIDNKTYFLDASEKLLPFGVVPFKCLNGDGRVMITDKKKGYWQKIEPIKNSGKKIQLILKLDEDENFTGNMRVVYDGYMAINKRKSMNENFNEEKYLSKIEEGNDYLEIDSYKNFDLDNQKNPFKEEFKVTIENDNADQKTIILNPFLVEKIDKNPFKLNKRLYPVDFGYPQKFEFIIAIDFPENYSIESFPSSRIIKLPQKKGHFVYKIDTFNSRIRINYSYVINETVFEPHEYVYLKELFKQLIIAQNEPIILKKN